MVRFEAKDNIQCHINCTMRKSLTKLFIPPTATTPEKALNLPPGSALQYLGGQTLFYRDDKKLYIDKAYVGNDIVYSIANLITNKVQVPEWGWYTVEDEKAYGQYKTVQKKLATSNYAQYGEGEFAAVSKDYKEMMGHRLKALKPYTSNERLNEIAKYPNASQTMSDLQAESAGYKLITGDKFKYAPLTMGGLNKGLPLEINNMPSQYMIIKTEPGLFPLRAGGYELQLGIYIPFKKEEILHEKYYNMQWSVYGDQLYGMSPVKAAWKRIQRSNEAMIAGISAFQNGGSEGILSPDIPDPDIWAQMTIEQRGQIKDQVDSVIQGGSKRNGSISVLNSPWKYTKIRLSPVDLDIMKLEGWDVSQLCNVWGVPSQIMNDPENKIQANASAGERALTTRCAMPILISERDSLNRKFQTDWGLRGKAIVLEPDLTCFTELEESKKEMVTWLKDAWWFTGNQKLQMMGEPTSTDPNMDKIYIPSSLVPLDQANEPLDAGNDQLDNDIDALDNEGVSDY